MIRLTCAEFGHCTQPATGYYTFRSTKDQVEQAIPVCAAHQPYATGNCRPIDELVLRLRATAGLDDARKEAAEVASLLGLRATAARDGSFEEATEVTS